jgi:DNA-binding response OmpR family regulator
MFKSDHIQNRVFTSTSAAMRPSTSARDLILCIDDEVRNLELRKLLLERAGYNVLACHSAKAGLAAFDSMPVRLVLLDFSMPGLNGAQLAKVMRRSKPHVPLLMLSGHPVPPNDVGKLVDLYLVKGGDPRTLLESVQRLLAERDQPMPKLPWSMSERNGHDQDVLNSWNEVAQYMGRGVSTVQRWEKDLGLPMHRPAGKSRAAVFAVATEIDEWIRTAPNVRSAGRSAQTRGHE